MSMGWVAYVQNNLFFVLAGGGRQIGAHAGEASPASLREQIIPNSLWRNWHPTLEVRHPNNSLFAGLAGKII